MISGGRRKAAAGLLIALCSSLAALALSRTALFRTLEWKVYDLELRRTADPSAANRNIVMIEIDDQSIERMAENDFGRFPWPRDTYAVLLRYLERGRPKAVVFDLLFLEQDKGENGPARHITRWRGEGRRSSRRSPGPRQKLSSIPTRAVRAGPWKRQVP